MFGFAPGFIFLGGLPDALAIPRRATPRPPVPPGSLLIAGGQALIASISMPTGWYQIGRTPARVFDWRRAPMTLADIGDVDHFRADRRGGFRGTQRRCAIDGGALIWPRLRVLAAGPGATIQDAGRRGYLRYGVTPAGPMDWTAFQTVALALGNDERAAAIEVSVGGLSVSAEDGPLVVAFAGGAFDWRRDGRPLPPAARLTLGPAKPVRAGRDSRRMGLSWRCRRLRYAGRDGQPGDPCALRHWRS